MEHAYHAFLEGDDDRCQALDDEKAQELEERAKGIALRNSQLQEVCRRIEGLYFGPGVELDGGRGWGILDLGKLDRENVSKLHWSCMHAHGMGRDANQSSTSQGTASILST